MKPDEYLSEPSDLSVYGSSRNNQSGLEHRSLLGTPPSKLRSVFFSGKQNILDIINSEKSEKVRFFLETEYLGPS